MHARLALALLLAAAAAGSPAGVHEIAPGVDLLRGAFVAGHQPDGNSVVFTAPQGLIVFDTGRHPEHTQQLVDFARAQERPVAAIVNSHWHLDHVGGNLILRETWPQVRVYASDAIREARRGFLADYRRQLAAVLAQGAGRPDEEAGYRAEIGLIDAGARLAPDEVIAASGMRSIAGRELLVGYEARAVTAGDVWMLDPQSGVLAAGDLVTLPVPLFDTACPRGWQAALDDLAKQKFTTLVPGHGAPMSRDDFNFYRRAFAALIDCAASSRDEQECTDAWFRDAGEQVTIADAPGARSMMHFYLTKVLRGSPAKTAKLCGQ